MKLVALLLALSLTASAQTTFTDPANLRGERVSPSDGHELPIDQGARGLQQLLRKLNTRGSLLLITAHPDDEDGGMLTLYSRGLGARVATLTLNRGEGGQNFMTADFEDALGLIRTQELLSADRYFDADQFFGTEVDFGFSKTKEESFQKWGHERVLYDAVRAIRLYRPLVIAAVFVGGVTDGHGQHQVSGEIAQEAFKAAADPTVFPDMVKEGILPWQASKVYARVPWADLNSKGVFDYATDQYVTPHFVNYVTGQVSTTKPTADVIVHEGDTDPILSAPGEPARSYVQFARIGLGLQRTQISRTMRLPGPGPYDSPYHLYASALHSTHPPAPQPFLPKNLTNQPTFFDGIDTSIEGIAALAPEAFPPDLLPDVARAITAATNHFDPSHPSAIAPDLASGLTNLDKLIAAVESWKGNPLQKTNALHELRIKRVQLNDALALALGLTFDATNTTPSGADIPEKSEVDVETSLSESAPVVAQLNNQYLQLEPPSKYENRLPPAEIAYADDFLRPGVKENGKLRLGPEFVNTITQPYFCRDNIEQPVYKLRDSALRNAPETPAPLTAWATVNYQGAEIILGRVVHDGPQPISIVPPVSIASAPTATVLRSGQPSAQLTATLRTDDATSANINVQSPHDWSIEAKAVPVSAANSTHSVDFFLHPTGSVTDPALFHVTAQTPDHHTYSEGFRPVGYPGLIYTNYYTPATTRVVPVDLKLPDRHRIAYLPGTGDAVPEALASIGLAPTILSVADLTPAKLAAFDTVILGVRTYAAHPDLHGAPTQALLDFARKGGNVLIQYQTSDFGSADAPYPLSLGYAEKVVDETAPVQILIPANPLLTTPNQITTADFGNWIEERGHGFLGTWDPHYTALTETHDPGGPETAPQLPQRGGLITTSVGKGRWTYCAYALYRQLPEAVPGAYRLFVNLVSPAR